MNVVPIQNPPEEAAAKCSNCAAAILADQRYCLSCGQPCSPVRLAFLDVLQAESDVHAPLSVVHAPSGYLPSIQADGATGWLRRYSGLLALLSMLLTTGLIGLLIGHWLTPSNAPTSQVLTIKGLPAAGVAPAASTTVASPLTPTAKAPVSASTSAAGEAQEKKEVREAEAPKTKPMAPVKTNTASLKKLEKLNGKRHQKAIEKLTEGGQPIETGG